MQVEVLYPVFGLSLCLGIQRNQRYSLCFAFFQYFSQRFNLFRTLNSAVRNSDIYSSSHYSFKFYLCQVSQL
ncbi:hypothetical protein FGO68_gene16064 [Halteria grandinella]|uniref:Uncharacterized protein n=1 Tax=Halteria grandinella TaxID=5974 RepID=A0A8J8T8L9_HALGN|nr:hypothetical protein FGO68_gene16064 [Halteria grandinella]